MTLKGIIFDFDGLITNSEYILYEVISAHFKKHHEIHLPKELYAKFVGLPDTDFYQYMKDTHNLDYDVHELNDILFEKIIAGLKDMDLMPGVKDFLKKAKASNLQLSIATSNSTEIVTSFLNKFEIESYFDFMYTADDVTHLKPHPEVYLKSIERHGFKSDELIVLEDSLPGYNAAQNAGLDVLLVLNDLTENLEIDEEIRRVYSFNEIEIL